MRQMISVGVCGLGCTQLSQQMAMEFHLGGMNLMLELQQEKKEREKIE